MKYCKPYLLFAFIMAYSVLCFSQKNDSCLAYSSKCIKAKYLADKSQLDQLISRKIFPVLIERIKKDSLQKQKFVGSDYLEFHFTLNSNGEILFVNKVISSINLTDYYKLKLINLIVGQGGWKVKQRKDKKCVLYSWRIVHYWI